MNLSQRQTKKTDEKIVGKYFLKPPNLSPIIRLLADSYSSKYCNIQQAVNYAESVSGENCFYCGNEIQKDLEYDHLYPASQFNLFCQGNIVKSCKSCNLEKSNKNPKFYIQQRFSRKLPTYFSCYDEYLNKINSMEYLYNQLHPEFYEIGVVGTDKTDNEIIIEHFLKDNKVVIEKSKPSKIEETLYTSLWEKTLNKLSEKYVESRLKQYLSRIVYLDAILERDFKGKEFGDLNSFGIYCKDLLYNVATEKPDFTLDVRNILIELFRVLYGDKGAEVIDFALPKNKNLWRFKR